MISLQQFNRKTGKFCFYLLGISITQIIAFKKIEIKPSICFKAAKIYNNKNTSTAEHLENKFRGRQDAEEAGDARPSDH